MLSNGNSCNSPFFWHMLGQRELIIFKEFFQKKLLLLESKDCYLDVFGDFSLVLKFSLIFYD